MSLLDELYYTRVYVGVEDVWFSGGGGAVTFATSLSFL